MNSKRERHIIRNMTALVVSILLFTAVLSIANPSSISSIASAVPIDDWSETSLLPKPVAGWNAIYHDGHIYLIGGRDSSGQPITNVYMAKLTSGGALESWKETSALKKPLFLHAVTADDTHIYAIGGWSGDKDKLQTTVWRASFIDGGGLGQWDPIGTYPTKIDLQGAVIVNNRLYVIGGWNGTAALSDIRYADITDSGLGSWTLETTNSLIEPLRRHAVAAHNGYIYVVGGFSSNASARVRASKVNTNGSLQEWIPVTSLPSARYYHRVVVHDGLMTVLGGTDGTTDKSEVITAKINDNGTLGNWGPQQALPVGLARFGAATVPRHGSDYVFVVGGLSNGVTQQKTYHSTVPPTPTPLPTATSTPFASVSLALDNEPKHWVAPGEFITYKLSYRNNGPSSISNAAIQDAIPDNTEILPDSVVPAGAINVAGEQEVITWSLGELAAGQESTVSYQVRRVTPTPISSVPGPLGITITGPTSGRAGDKLDYQIEVTNRVNIELLDIQIRAVVPDGATYVEGGGGTLEDGIIKWDFPSIQGDSVNSVDFSLSSDKTLVQSNYEVETAAGQRGIGSDILVTVIDNLPPPATGDGIMIVNADASITWQLNDTQGETRANSVRNPALKNVYLPITERP